MRSFRARPIGWRNEPYRHYLSAKGVSTKRYEKRKFVDIVVDFVDRNKDFKIEKEKYGSDSNDPELPKRLRSEARVLRAAAEMHPGRASEFSDQAERLEREAFFREHKGAMYAAFKEDKGLFSADTVDDLDKELRQRNVQEMADESVKYLQEKEEDDHMNSEWTERFMQYEFKNFSDRYLNDPLYTRKQFQDDVRKRVRSHAQTHSGTLKAFDWAEEAS